MRPLGPPPRAPAWQRSLAFVVAGIVLFAWLPLWAAVLLTSATVGLVLAGPIVAARRRARPRSIDVGQAASLLGTDSSEAPVALTDGQLEAHTVIVGASGSGKSTTLLRILTDQIRSGKGVVAIDLKGSPSFVAQLGRAAEEAGRAFRLWTPDGPTAWNPLAYGNPTELKDKLISSERFTEIHYQRAAERYLQNALQVLQATHGPDGPPILHDLVAAMEPARLEGLLRSAPPELANRVQDYLEKLTGDQLSAIRGLGTRLAIITESHTGSYLGGASPLRDNVDLRAALRGEQVVVFSLNSSSYGKLAAQLGAIAIQDLITVAGERMANPSLRHPASVAVDEFSALDRGGDHVLGLNARCREAGIGALVSAQEPTDFERAARGLLNQILGSTAVKIVHRLDVPSSAEMVAQLAGTHTVWEQSHHVEHHPLFGDRASGRSVVREVERFLVHPNVIKSLPTGRAVVITKVPETRVRIVDVAPPTRPPGSVRTADLAASGRVPRAADSGGSGRVPRTADSGGSGRVARVWPTRPPVRRAGERSYGESTQRLPEPERDGPEAE